MRICLWSVRRRLLLYHDRDRNRVSRTVGVRHRNNSGDDIAGLSVRRDVNCYLAGLRIDAESRGGGVKGRAIRQGWSFGEIDLGGRTCRGLNGGVGGCKVIGLRARCRSFLHDKVDRYLFGGAIRIGHGNEPRDDIPRLGVRRNARRNVAALRVHGDGRIVGGVLRALRHAGIAHLPCLLGRTSNTANGQVARRVLLCLASG